MKAPLSLLAASLLACRAASAQDAGSSQDRWAHVRSRVQKAVQGAPATLVPVQYQTTLPPAPTPIAPIQAPSLNDAANISARENAVIMEFRSNVEHDPLNWKIPLSAVPPERMLPSPAPVMRGYDRRDLVELRSELNRLKGLLAAKGILISIQGMTCALGASASTPLASLQRPAPGSRSPGEEAEDELAANTPGEGLANDIAGLIVAIANVQRRIAEVQGSVDESGLYRSCLREAGVTPPPVEIIAPPGQVHTEPLDDDQPRPRYVPPEAPIQDTRPPCEPETEYFNDHILVPRQVGFDRDGEPVYNEVWQTIRRERPKYKPGC